MSIVDKIQSITNHLSEAYSSLEEKGATIPSDKNIENLSDSILSIPSGGVSVVTLKDINFYDYDGTLFESWTLDELQSKTSLPNNPEHDGLTFQGWNWTLGELQTQNSIMDVGAQYITDDGKTRIYITLTSNDSKRLKPYIGIGQNKANGFRIDWGDGTSSLSGSKTSITTPINITHTYSSSGSYVITLTPIVANVEGRFLGTSTCSEIFYGGTTTEASSHNSYYNGCVEKINIGSNFIRATDYGFYGLRRLTSISIPSTLNFYGTSIFSNCNLLSGLTVPRGTTSFNSALFTSCIGLKELSFPGNLTGTIRETASICYNLRRIACPSGVTGINALSSMTNLEEVYLSNSITQITQNAFQYAYNLKKIHFPESLTFIGNNAFNGCAQLTELIFPPNLNSMGYSIFNNCTGMVKYDFSRCLQVPTLTNSNSFNGKPTDCIIVVPDSLYATWITTAQWSNVASSIKKASEI